MLGHSRGSPQIRRVIIWLHLSSAWKPWVLAQPFTTKPRFCFLPAYHPAAQSFDMHACAHACFFLLSLSHKYTDMCTLSLPHAPPSTSFLYPHLCLLSLLAPLPTRSSAHSCPSIPPMQSLTPMSSHHSSPSLSPTHVCFLSLTHMYSLTHTHWILNILSTMFPWKHCIHYLLSSSSRKPLSLCPVLCLCNNYLCKHFLCGIVYMFSHLTVGSSSYFYFNAVSIWPRMWHINKHSALRSTSLDLKHSEHGESPPENWFFCIVHLSLLWTTNN